MKITASLKQRYETIRASYWFWPTVMAVGAILLAEVMSGVDKALGADWLRSIDWLTANESEGARAVLSTIAGSIITVAGVTFSMTMVAVSFAGAQFGPRLIGNFMRDTGNQITLGTFIATFVYALMLLRTVRGGEEAFVPHLSLMMAIGLALANVAVLIYFIHHVPETINISNITADVGRKLKDRIDRLFPHGVDTADDEPDDTPREKFRNDGRIVRSQSNGYIEALDLKGLIEVAARHDLCVRLDYRPGDFATEGDVLCVGAPRDAVTEDAVDGIRKCFAMGPERTISQNELFLVDQLIEIMARALSPGVNDPFTAMNCINWLGVGLRRMAQASVGSALLTDDDGEVRVLARPVDFGAFCDHLFGRSRPYVSSDRNAALHMLGMIGNAMMAIDRRDQRSILLGHAEVLAEACAAELPLRDSRDTVERHYEQLQNLMNDLDGATNLAAVHDEYGRFGGSA